MKKFIFLFSFLFSQVSFAQSELYLLDEAKKIMLESKTCVLNTIDYKNGISSRIMDPLLTNKGFIVFMVTNPSSRKVTEIKKNPNVALTFQNDNGYITLKGKVLLINDLNEKIKYWKNSWTPFYKNKESSLLLKLVPVSLEIVNPDAEIFGDPKTWSPKKIIL